MVLAPIILVLGTLKNCLHNKLPLEDELQNEFCFTNYILVENLKRAHPEGYHAPTPCRL